MKLALWITCIALSLSSAFAQTSALYIEGLAHINEILKESAKRTDANYSVSIERENTRPILKIVRSFQLNPTKKGVYGQEVYLDLLDPSQIEVATSGLDVPNLKMYTKNKAAKVRMTTIILADRVDPEEKNSQDKSFMTILCDKKQLPELKSAFENLLTQKH